MEFNYSTIRGLQLHLNIDPVSVLCTTRGHYMFHLNLQFNNIHSTFHFHCY